ncbi:hypothetical protein SAMN05660380_02169 [Xylella fastidiosa]|nr:hypothetical protein XFEB_02372 [Xylella fastidiosa EB92.1]SHH11787.1 hypothetical protein SAMN05660380_02169 [Xylella fastidiosa]
MRDGYLWRVFHQKVDVIVLTVHFDQFCLEIGADPGEDGTKSLDGVAIEHIAAIFRHKDQMNMHLKDAMSSMSNIVFIAHRPRV